MPQKDPVVRRDETIRGVIMGAFAVTAAAAIMLSERPLVVGNSPGVLPGAAIPAGAAPKGYAAMLDDYGVHVPKLRRRPLFSVAPVDAPPPREPEGVAHPLRYGYSILETSVLGLPFFARKDDGHVIYYETPREFVYALATDDYLRRIRMPGPRPLDRQWFPWWRHLWGWLFVLALGGIGLFELGALRRRRAAEGLI